MAWLHTTVPSTSHSNEARDFSQPEPRPRAPSLRAPVSVSMDQTLMTVITDSRYRMAAYAVTAQCGSLDRGSRVSF
jgi:hypothetical protein